MQNHDINFIYSYLLFILAFLTAERLFFGSVLLACLAIIQLIIGAVKTFSNQ